MISLFIEKHGNIELTQHTTGHDLLGILGDNHVIVQSNPIVFSLDDQFFDLSSEIVADGRLSFISREDDRSLPHLRHDCAHVLAEAVQSLFPESLVCFGPAIDNGFYYDFYRETPFSDKDLPLIEEKMHEIIAMDAPFQREEWSREEAYKFFSDKGEIFKAEHVLSLPEGEEISIYKQGSWQDLCRGPHAPSTKYIGNAFHLTHVSGAYWKGDSDNAQLQRIYGTCWKNKKDLRVYLNRIKEAEKRDHRKLGLQLELFHLQSDAPGAVFWHPAGWKLYKTLENYVRMRISREGYQEVKTPQLLDRKLWEMSGHWEKYREHMFVLEHKEDKKSIALKPMNCPCHVEIFKKRTVSYRELPLRMSEFGSCHRNEPAGALHGIMRVRAFTQDDAHIFCLEEQIASETAKFCTLLSSIYEDLGFNDITVMFSDRPKVRAGSEQIWDKAEQSLMSAVEEAGIPYTLNRGDGAFYGPKLDFILKDALDREWQCGTLQADFVLPARLNASYIGSDGEKHVPVMLHRAILGSFERFIGILIEHYEGKFPIWLAPQPLAITTITNLFDDYAQNLYNKTSTLDIPTIFDDRNETINYKIRDLSLKKIPIIWIVGAKEVEQGTVTVRKLGQKKQVTMSEADAVEEIIKLRKMPSS